LWISKATEDAQEIENLGEPMRKRKRQELPEDEPIVERAPEPEPAPPPLDDEPAVIPPPPPGAAPQNPVMAEFAAGGRRLPGEVDADANAGSDYDAMPDSEEPLDDIPAVRLSIPNSVFRPARILVNPRCVTTYAGVSHTQLALDLFGPDREEEGSGGVGKYVLEDWDGAPESFVCQEQRSVKP
jgi:hypothetical protein